MHVCSLSYFGGIFTEGNLKYEGNELWMQFPHIVTITNIEILKDYGIFSNPVTFSVEYIDKNKLILKDGDEIVTLRKF